MGIIRMGPPKDLVLQLANRYHLKDFVETGTYQGATALWACTQFERVITIEISDAMYSSTKPKLDAHHNIEFIKGHSKTHLPEIGSRLARPAIIWLDGHWCGGETYGIEDECPLLQEIEALHRSSETHYLFIDDARFFTSPPSHPHNPTAWPNIQEIIDALQSRNHHYYIVIIEDVIVAVPIQAKDWLVAYCQDLNTRLFKEYLKRHRWVLLARRFGLFPERQD